MIQVIKIYFKEKDMCKYLQESKEKVKLFIENKNFDLLIMSLICLNAIVFGFMTSDHFNQHFGNVLFILDRLCMAIFIVEMMLKLYVYSYQFFKSRWNIFDFSIIFISSFSLYPIITLKLPKSDKNCLHAPQGVV